MRRSIAARRPVSIGRATFTQVSEYRPWGYGASWDVSPARWACVDCGAKVDGTDERPWIGTRGLRNAPDQSCARNGHAPCRACGKLLPRLNDGCPREHRWDLCPEKTEADRLQPQHAHVHDLRVMEASA